MLTANNWNTLADRYYTRQLFPHSTTAIASFDYLTRETKLWHWSPAAAELMLPWQMWTTRERGEGARADRRLAAVSFEFSHSH